MTKEDVVGTYEYQYNASKHIVGFHFAEDNTVQGYVNYETGEGDEYTSKGTWEIIGDEIHGTGPQSWRGPNKNDIITEVFKFTSDGNLYVEARIKHDPDTGLSPRVQSSEPKRGAIFIADGVERRSHAAGKIKSPAQDALDKAVDLALRDQDSPTIPGTKDWNKPTTDPDNLA